MNILFLQYLLLKWPWHPFESPVGGSVSGLYNYVLLVYMPVFVPLCFITVVLCLKLGNIGSLALFFLRIALFFQSPLLFTVTFRVLFSISIQSDIGILTKIN